MPELVKRDGGVICYDVQGPADGPAMLLIEGLSAHLLGWRDGFCRPFTDAGFRVIRFDNRDVGRSQRYPGQSYRLRDMAEDLHELIHQLRIAPTHVVGQSMGGMVAQHLVLSHPEDVASLTLLYTAASARHLRGDERSIETLLGAPRASTREEAIEIHIEQERVCASTGFSFDEAWKRELGGLMWDRGYDPAGVARQARALFADPVNVRALSAVDVPTLIIHGTGDQLIPHTGSVELHHAIPGSDLWLIEGMGHDLPRELWPDLTSRIIANAAQAAEPESRSA